MVLLPVVAQRASRHVGRVVEELHAVAVLAVDHNGHVAVGKAVIPAVVPVQRRLRAIVVVPRI